MTDIEPSPINQSLGPAQPNDMSTSHLIQRAAADLTPRQAMWGQPKNRQAPHEDHRAASQEEQT